METSYKKLLPFTVRVKDGPPAGREFGAMVVTVGFGLALVTVKMTSFEVPPPVAGLKTVIETGPGVTKSSAAISASSFDLFRKVVGLMLPFHRTTDSPATKLPSSILP